MATKKSTAKTAAKAASGGAAKKATTKAAKGTGTKTSKTTKAAGKKASSTGSATKATKGATTTAKKTTATKATTKKSAKKKSTTKTATKKSTTTKTSAASLVVREDESPWTAAELAEVRAELEADVTRLREEIQLAESDLVDLMSDPLDGAGDDQADAGAKSYERDQEITLTNNARAVLLQNLHALERIDDGSYGVCESCGNPIGKLRLQAYPRSSLCVSCKSQQERR